VRAPRRVGAHLDLGLLVLAHRLGQLIERVHQDGDVIGGGAGYCTIWVRGQAAGMAARRGWGEPLLGICQVQEPRVR
jgi:hypothetical protein